MSTFRKSKSSGLTIAVLSTLLVASFGTTGLLINENQKMKENPETVEVPVEVPVEVEKIVERIVERQVEVPVEVEKIVEVEKEVEKIVEVEKEVEKIVEVEVEAPQDFTDLVNASTKLGTKKFKYPTEAIDYLEEEGIDTFDILATKNLVLDIDANKFGIVKDGKAYFNANDQGSTLTKNTWKFVKEVAEGETQPCYIIGNKHIETLKVSNSVDLGGNINIKNVKYVNKASEGITSYINTNNMITNIYVDAPNDTINHFGLANLIDIKACADHSYIEYGSGKQVKIAEGHLVVDETSDIKSIHISKKADVEEFEQISITLNGNVKMPNLSRDPISDLGEGKKVCTIEQGETKEEIWLVGSGTKEEAVVKSGEEKVEASELTGKAIDQLANVAKTGTDGEVIKDAEGKIVAEEKGQSAEEALGKIDEEEAVKTKYETATHVTKASGHIITPDVSWYDAEEVSFILTTPEQLAGLAKLVNEGNTFKGKKIVLGNDLVLSEKEYLDDNSGLKYFDWVAIGTGTVAGTEEGGNYFEGTFDGNNCTIYGMTQNCYCYGARDAMPYGLFGYVRNATIKNLVMEDINIHTETDAMYAGQEAGGVVGTAFGNTTFDNITVRNSYICGYIMAAGPIAGCIENGNFLFNNINVEVSTVVTTWYDAKDTQCGGLVGCMDYHAWADNAALDDATSGTTSHVKFTNCTVATNVTSCLDWDWYYYRSAGMIIGTFTNCSDHGWNNGQNIDAETLATLVECNSVTVIYDTWNIQQNTKYNNEACVLDQLFGGHGGGGRTPATHHTTFEGVTCTYLPGAGHHHA